MQTLALTIFLIWASITIAIFVFVARSGSSPGELPLKAYKRNRALFLFFLCVGSVLLLYVTLPLTPYPDEGVAPDRVIYASAKQFAFKLSDHPITREDAMDDEVFLSIKPINAGELIEFRISAADVTHGFCIYNPEGEIQTQTQAMPGYVNRLRYRFPREGAYPVLCLEFCGIGHFAMKAQLEVIGAPASNEQLASSVHSPAAL